VSLSGVMSPFISQISQEREGQAMVSLEKPMDFTLSAAWARSQCSFTVP